MKRSTKLRKKTAMELLEQYLQFKQQTEKESKKTKKEKDPLKPKHHMSAYFVFSIEDRIEEQATIYARYGSVEAEERRKKKEERRKKKEEEVATLKKEEEELMKLQKQEAMQPRT